MHISIKKDKKKFLYVPNKKNVIDNRKIWKPAKPIFSNKQVFCEKIKWVENEKIITDYREIKKL